MVDVAQLPGVEPLDRFFARFQLQHVGDEEGEGATPVGFQPAGAPGPFRAEPGRERSGYLTQFSVEGTGPCSRAAGVKNPYGCRRPTHPDWVLCLRPGSDVQVAALDRQAFE